MLYILSLINKLPDLPTKFMHTCPKLICSNGSLTHLPLCSVFVALYNVGMAIYLFSQL